MMSVTNSYIIKKELTRDDKKSKRQQTLISFIVPLAESLIKEGQKTAGVTRSNRGGRRLKRPLEENKDHLPAYEPKSRMRCVRCVSLGRERRTTQYCLACTKKYPLCKTCFAPYHS
jgi:hypothetical protein